METLKNLIKEQHVTEPNSPIIPSSNTDTLQADIDNYNSVKGDLTECSVCMGRGYVAVNKKGYMVLDECECMIEYKLNILLKLSGLKNLVDRYTFEAFDKSKADGQRIYNTAMRYLDNYKDRWFFIGGQVGSGKTAICTPITYHLMRKGYETRYVLWRDLIARIKEGYDKGNAEEIIEKLQKAKIVYIDDFLKGDRPSQNDLDIAYKIINYRYNNNLTTILSSERMLMQISELDEAIGSRIFERAKGFILNVGKDEEKNYRYKISTDRH